MDVAEAEELPRVMREITEAMGGCGAALTLHPARSGPSIVYSGGSDVPPATLLDELLRKGTLAPDVDPERGFAWLECRSASAAWQIIVLPIQKIAGHSPLAIAVFFGEMTPDRKAEAEAVYLRRRPFAVGYFRLWQLDRIRRRTIDALQAVLDLTSVGVMLLDRSGGLTFLNQSARALLDAADGLRERDGRLRAVSLADAARLQAAITHVVAPERASDEMRAPMLTIKRKGGPDLTLSILPASPAPSEPGDVAATIFVVDPANDTEQLLEPVCRLFKLSRVETQLTCRLAAGATLCEAATTLRLREQTARTYLRQIFAKTGTNRQSDLVRTILSRAVRVSDRVRFEIV